jgi:hypothetical protein
VNPYADFSYYPYNQQQQQNKHQRDNLYLSAIVVFIVRQGDFAASTTKCGLSGPQGRHLEQTHNIILQYIQNIILHKFSIYIFRIFIFIYSYIFRISTQEKKNNKDLPFLVKRIGTFTIPIPTLCHAKAELPTHYMYQLKRVLTSCTQKVVSPGLFFTTCRL